MSLPALNALVLGLSLTAYAVFAGADFGAGILDLLAGREDGARREIAATIGPLWEANHVWLIFSITILFSAFPAAFSALGASLLAPFTIALLAIVVRSAALGLRASPGSNERNDALLDRLFGVASLIAPFTFGLVAGGVAKTAAGATPSGGSVPAIAWTSPFAVVVGALAVAVCAQLAATFVAFRLARAGDARAAEGFRRRALRATGVVLALMIIALGIAAANAPRLSDRLTAAGLPAVVVGILAAGAALPALASRRYGVARAMSVLAGSALLWGWFAAQAPHLVGTRLTIHTAAASHPALAAIAIAAGVVLVLVLPAMYLAFAVFARPLPEVIE